MIEVKYNLNPEQNAPVLMNLNEIGIISKALVALRESVTLPDPDENMILTEMLMFINDKLMQHSETYYNMPNFPPISCLTPEEFNKCCGYIYPSLAKAAIDIKPKTVVK